MRDIRSATSYQAYVTYSRYMCSSNIKLLFFVKIVLLSFGLQTRWVKPETIELYVHWCAYTFGYSKIIISCETITVEKEKILTHMFFVFKWIKLITLNTFDVHFISVFPRGITPINRCALIVLAKRIKSLFLSFANCVHLLCF